MMKLVTFLKTLCVLDEYKIFVFTINELRNWFPHQSDKALKAALARYVKQDIIEHVCRGVYLNPQAKYKDAYALEHIAKVLRRGHYNYISLESLLSAVGVISQVPLSLLTVMTTGRNQIYKTKYGNIEFTHTERSVTDILQNSYKTNDNPLRLAKTETAIRDLKRVRRNTHLISEIKNDETR